MTDFDTITVYYEGIPLLLFKTVADIMGLKSGARINAAQQSEAIRNNSEYGIALCHAEIQRAVIRGDSK